MKCVLRAWGQLKRGFHVLAPGEMWGQVKRGFQVLVPGEMCFEGMGAVAKGVSRVGTG